jgi:hypothetical protein
MGYAASTADRMRQTKAAKPEMNLVSANINASVP